ncbi:DUF4355 domain-containing protein [Enterococcus faecium]|uniref:DUF4355 domain-containing protein n=1 Tax=Enterococcus TaxID=1350 RepID=UPI00032EBCA5|nr:MULTISPECIES: DUF4355 domain-containing protein [Enterococcus]DAP81940.1 MAG TPA: Major head protein [Caudoviricetes sp.]EGO9939025.1 DUF4355 domain-containing protein [Enterococcus faecium]EME8230880.1 DUF4355 domain-containing protein [Enterococcus faecium]EOM08214.1 hypothetical protein U9U_01227 [Enterococcus faecium EnGen0260]EOM09183.1 hypothetical protein U9W_02625 [Enterococcus faecium EnGen0261]
MKVKKLLPMNLQFFAEDDAADVTPDNTSGNSADNKEKNGSDPTDADKKYSDADVDKIIAAKFAKWEAKQQQEKDEAAKLAEMDDKEKADYEKQQLEAKLAEFERKEVLSKMSEQASEMLSEKGAKPTKEMLRLIVSEDAETTSNNVKTYLASVEAEREAIKAEYEKRLGGKIPLDGNGTTISRGAQLAKNANNQTKKPENDPWAIK